MPNLPEDLRLVDAHCHLDAEHFVEGAEAVMERGLRAGVVGFVVVGVGPDLGSARHAIPRHVARRLWTHDVRIVSPAWRPAR